MYHFIRGICSLIQKNYKQDGTRDVIFTAEKSRVPNTLPRGYGMASPRSMPDITSPYSDGFHTIVLYHRSLWPSNKQNPLSEVHFMITACQRSSNLFFFHKPRSYRNLTVTLRTRTALCCRLNTDWKHAPHVFSNNSCQMGV